MNKFGVSLHPGGEGLTFSLPPRTAELLTMEEAIELAICILLRAGINGPTDKRLAGAFAEAFRAPAGDDDNESTTTERVNDDTPPARRGAGGAARLCQRLATLVEIAEALVAASIEHANAPASGERPQAEKIVGRHPNGQ